MAAAIAVEVAGGALLPSTDKAVNMVGTQPCTVFEQVLDSKL